MDSALTTELLNRFATGDRSLERSVIERIHEELREVARQQMAKGPGGATLQPTALVHEAWLRIAGRGEVHFDARRQFFRFAGKLMRNLLVDHARAGSRERADVTSTTIEIERGFEESLFLDVLDLEAVLRRLEEREPALARVVELRFFCGLSNELVAEAMETSLRTVERRWRFARAWLLAELGRG